MAIRRKTLGLRSFFANFSQAFVRPIWWRYVAVLPTSIRLHLTVNIDLGTNYRGFMFQPTQSQFNKYGKTPTEDASAEKHIIKAIERFQYRENKTEDVKVNAYKLEEFYKMYEQ